MEDITIRAIKTLFSVDIIACEDTRRTGLLLQELKKRFQSVIPSDLINRNTPLLRYDDRQERAQSPLLIQKLEEGKSVALVSDAGTPLIADPGYTLVHEAIKRRINVVSIPGPSAAIAALSVSGLPTNNFLFLGYPPEKEKHRKDLFKNLLTMKSSVHPTIIFYCAPHKLQQTLTDLQTVLGDISIIIARELTKVHEEVWSGNTSEALLKFEDPVGELILMISGNR